MSWMPYGLMSLYSAFTGSLEWHSIVTSLPVMFAKTSAIWNPIVFIGGDRTLRRFTKQLICGCRVTTLEPGSESSGSSRRNTKDKGPTRPRQTAAFQIRPAAFALKLAPPLIERHLGKTVIRTEIVERLPNFVCASTSSNARKDLCDNNRETVV